MSRAAEIARELIAIPSHISRTTNENELARYIADHLSNYAPVDWNYVVADRPNLFVRFGESPIKLLFACHMDTVDPWGKEEGKFSPFSPTIIEDRLYGRGSNDMKGGIASLLTAIEESESQNLEGMAILFTIDEETDFLGMKHFIENQAFYNTCFTEETFVICPEPSAGICNSQRGLIELRFTVHGESAHAGMAYPGNLNQGNNAIIGVCQAIAKLRDYLNLHQHDTLGHNSMNLSFIHGGTNSGKHIISRGNMVANICRFTLDIRPVVFEINAQSVADFLKNEITNTGLTVSRIAKIHDYPYMFTPKEDFQKFNQIVLDVTGELEYGQMIGYAEGEMIRNSLGLSVVNYGPRRNETSHKPDEYVEISQLDQVAEVFKKTIRAYCL